MHINTFICHISLPPKPSFGMGVETFSGQIPVFPWIESLCLPTEWTICTRFSQLGERTKRRGYSWISFNNTVSESHILFIMLPCFHKLEHVMGHANEMWTETFCIFPAWKLLQDGPSFITVSSHFFSVVEAFSGWHLLSPTLRDCSVEHSHWTFVPALRV